MPLIALSFILCSRNDNYMGDPMWRLATAINYLAKQADLVGRKKQIEVIVADWGSETPIAEVLKLTEAAASITKFLYIDPATSKELQKDSPFAEVFPLNAAAKRATGEYIGRIDQDTLVHRDFLKHFFDHYEGNRDYGFQLSNSYMFVSRMQIPFRFAQKCPSLTDVEYHIDHFGKWSYSEEQRFCHWASPVGILMMHRDIWDDIGGYDERLIYYWYMDVDLATRLIKKYPIINIRKTYGNHFYHLEHVKPGLKFRFSHRKRNPNWSKSFNKPVLNPNGSDWGMAQFALPITKISTNTDVENDFKLQELVGTRQKIFLFLLTAIASLRRWGYYQLKFCWYLSKRLLGKPYL